MWWMCALAWAAPEVERGTPRFEPSAEIELSLVRAIEIALEQNPEVDTEVFAEQLAAIETRRAKLDRFSLTVDAASDWGAGVVKAPDQDAVATDAFSYSLETRAGWTLFSGGAIQNSIRSAEIGERIAALDRQQVERELIRAVYLAYWNIQGLEAEIAAARESLDSTDEALKIIIAKEQAGLAATLDVNRSTVDLLSGQGELISLEAELYGAEQDLLQLLHVQPTGVRLTDSIEREDAPSIADAQAWVDRAKDSRPDFAGWRERRKQAEVARKLAISGYFPTVGLQAYAGMEAESPLIADGDRELRPTISAGGGLYFSWNAFDWLRTRDAVESARIREKQVDATLASQELALETDVRQALETVRSLRERSELVEKRIELARDNLKIVRDLYAQGSASLLELFDAQAAFRSASSQRAAFQVSLVNAEYELLWTVGERFVQN